MKRATDKAMNESKQRWCVEKDETDLEQERHGGYHGCTSRTEELVH